MTTKDLSQLDIRLHRLDATESLHSHILWSLNKTTNNPVVREQIAEAVSSSAPWQVPVSALGIEGENQQQGDALAREGWVQLTQSVSREACDEINTYFESKTPIETHMSLDYYSIEDIFLAPHVLEVITDPNILEIIAIHLGVAPTIIDICSWRSPATSETVAGSQIPHRDREDFKFCKLFIYLNDVDHSGGPHAYLPRSHTLEGMTELCREGGLDQTSVSGFFAKDHRLSAETLLDKLGSKFHAISGKMGSMFIADTFGYHFGYHPISRPRFVIQAVYGQMVHGQRHARLKNTHPFPLPDLIKAHPLRAFACRLLGQY